MTKISSYTIVTGKDGRDLRVQVNKKIKTGWTPIGGPFKPIASEYWQAMIK